jgi:GH15 family glucan-1,4-alpha-glucosidase
MGPESVAKPRAPRQLGSRMAAKLEDYALIGDCQTAALIGRSGSIDWLCWPRFDSGACFAALLGAAENGHWSIGAVDQNARITRRYRDSTLILETDIETSAGAATVVDFMPLRDDACDLVRLVQGKRGKTAIKTELVIRFDYGSLVPWVTHLDDGSLSAVAGPDMVVLRTPAMPKAKGFSHVGEFEVSAGEVVPFVLTYGRSYDAASAPIDPLAALAATETFWRKWLGRCTTPDEWSEPVNRSLITLKALTYAPTGGIVAAVTTSLPEQAGGSRNWDYRYCWLRDATFTLLALMNSGYFEEAQAWRLWLLRAVAGAPQQAQIMYGLTGERRLTEWQATWLSGYENSRPVRIGNAASEQLQLDIYGEVFDALYQGRCGKLKADEAGWSLQQAMLEHLATIWREPDEGIWEVRGGPRHFIYSKVMAWVAFDRAIKSAETFGVGGPVDQWRKIRQTIHDEVCERGFNRDIGAFVQSYDSKRLDASVLLLPLVGFLPPSDPRIGGTVENIQTHLMSDGFVKRYNTAEDVDGLSGDEGAFLACSFWLADNLVLLGRRAEARKLFVRLLSLRNDLGLLSEEYDPKAKRLLGNFPQALSHIALVNTAHNLSMAEKPAKQRSSPSPRS